MYSTKERAIKHNRIYCELCKQYTTRHASVYSSRYNTRICRSHTSAIRVLTIIEEHNLLYWFTPQDQLKILLLAVKRAEKLAIDTAGTPYARKEYIHSILLEKEIDEYDNITRTSQSCMWLLASSIGTEIAIAKLKQPHQWFKLLSKEVLKHAICRIFRAVEREPSLVSATSG